jgi:hypothetical protein
MLFIPHEGKHSTPRRKNGAMGKSELSNRVVTIITSDCSFVDSYCANNGLEFQIAYDLPTTIQPLRH